jgi:hypothetical protein
LNLRREGLIAQKPLPCAIAESLFARFKPEEQPKGLSGRARGGGLDIISKIGAASGTIWLFMADYVIDLDPIHQVLRLTIREVLTDQLLLDAYGSIGQAVSGRSLRRHLRLLGCARCEIICQYRSIPGAGDSRRPRRATARGSRQQDGLVWANAHVRVNQDFHWP